MHAWSQNEEHTFPVPSSTWNDTTEFRLFAKNLPMSILLSMSSASGCDVNRIDHFCLFRVYMNGGGRVSRGVGRVESRSFIPGDDATDCATHLIELIQKGSREVFVRLRVCACAGVRDELDGELTREGNDASDSSHTDHQRYSRIDARWTRCRGEAPWSGREGAGRDMRCPRWRGPLFPVVRTWTLRGCCTRKRA